MVRTMYLVSSSERERLYTPKLLLHVKDAKILQMSERKRGSVLKVSGIV